MSSYMPLDLSNPTINIYPQHLTELKTIKPKKKKLCDKIFSQYPHVILKRIFTERSYFAKILNHSIPDKGRHKIAILPLSCNLISQLILRKFRRKHLNMLPEVNYVIFNHHIFISKHTFKVLMIRIITKPNWKVLLIINLLENPIKVISIHKDHNTYDVFEIPSKHMLLFLHTFRKDDPFVKFVLFQQRIKIEKKCKVGAIVWELKQKAIIDTNYSYVPIRYDELLKKKLKRINSKLCNRIIKYLSKSSN